MTNDTNKDDDGGPSSSIPATMKAVVATGFGDVDKNIFLRTDWPTPPRLDSKSKSNNDEYMLIKVLCCALAPGDVRMLSGKTSWVQLPKSGHPYVIGSDVSGIVVNVGGKKSQLSLTDKDQDDFQPGDYVISRFELPGPVGGMAEYRRVKKSLTVKCPTPIPPTIACGLTASSMTAKKIVHDNMKQGNRCLVIGASGGVGSNVVQYAKLYGASLVAAVSTQEQLVKSLGADVVIDYRKENWWEMKEFENKKFDVVFDMVSGDNWTVGACSGKAVKPRRLGGKYVSLLPGVEWEIECNNIWDLAKINCLGIGRLLYSRWYSSSLPEWVIADVLDKITPQDFRELVDDVSSGRLRPILDPASPFEFTQQGVRQAMELQESKHAHGKVVVQVSSEH